MKHISFLLILTISCFVSTATRSIICGEVSRKELDDKVSLYYYASPMDDIAGKRVSRTVPVINGHYRFELDLQRPVKVYLQSGDTWLSYNNYIAPGDSLVLSYTDSSQIFDGQCGDCNALLYLRNSRIFDDSATRAAYQASRKLSPTYFLAFSGRMRDISLAMMDSFAKHSELTEDFKRHYRHRIDYEYGVNMVQYTWRYSLQMQDSVFLQHLNRIQLNNPNALSEGMYVHFLRELPYAAWRSLSTRPGISDSLKTFYSLHSDRIRDSIARVFFTGECLDVALFHILHDKVRNLKHSQGQDAFDSLYRRELESVRAYSAAFGDKQYAQRILGEMEDLRKVRKAPDFALRDLEGKEVRLSELRGKVVYVDFWATSCAPCVREIPYIKSLQQSFVGKDVVFLFVSVGDDLQYLKRFIKAKGFDGLHLTAPEGFGAEVAREYEISGLPRYMVIDREGNLVTSDAPRPSSRPESLLESVLEKM